MPPPVRGNKQPSFSKEFGEKSAQVSQTVDSVVVRTTELIQTGVKLPNGEENNAEVTCTLKEGDGVVTEGRGSQHSIEDITVMRQDMVIGEQGTHGHDKGVLQMGLEVDEPGEWVDHTNKVELEMIESEQGRIFYKRLLKPYVSMGRKWRRVL